MLRTVAAMMIMMRYLVVVVGMMVVTCSNVLVHEHIWEKQHHIYVYICTCIYIYTCKP